MTENTFFDNWAGRSVDFATAGTPSKWILTELLSEKNSQVHGDDFFKNGCIGGAYGTFLCHNVTDSTQRGVMKVLMQVPWEGSQYAPAEHRSSQASGSYELDWNITSQLNALITLTSNNCLSTPRILDLKYGWQETADPVPGGYIIFILMSYLPGVQLTKAFWGLEDSVREQIRQAFKLTWLDCVGSGITPAHPNIEHVFWDAAANKAYVVFPVNNENEVWACLMRNAVYFIYSYIISFRESEPAKREDVWQDVNWSLWGMAKPQESYNSQPDESKWMDSLTLR